jgi:hypothetical protein
MSEGEWTPSTVAGAAIAVTAYVAALVAALLTGHWRLVVFSVPGPIFIISFAIIRSRRSSRGR